jgi:hypothetical protein
VVYATVSDIRVKSEATRRKSLSRKGRDINLANPGVERNIPHSNLFPDA